MDADMFQLQAAVSAGPRKELDSDRQLGEDVAAIAQTADRAAFCLCDGTSGEGQFLNLSTRRLAQDFASEFVGVAARAEPEELAKIAAAAVRRVEQFWNLHFASIWGQQAESGRNATIRELGQETDGVRMMKFSFVFVGGVYFPQQGRLFCVSLGDCQAWWYRRQGKPVAVPPSSGRAFFRVLQEKTRPPRLEPAARLYRLRGEQHEDIAALICLTDGAGVFEQLNGELGQSDVPPEVLIRRIRSLRVRTGDDRGVITGCSVQRLASVGMQQAAVADPLPAIVTDNSSVSGIQQAAGSPAKGGSGIANHAADMAAPEPAQVAIVQCGPITPAAFDPSAGSTEQVVDSGTISPGVGHCVPQHADGFWAGRQAPIEDCVNPGLSLERGPQQPIAEQQQIVELQSVEEQQMEINRLLPPDIQPEVSGGDVITDTAGGSM